MKLQFFKYKIPFIEPFRTASGVFEEREGIFIQLNKDEITALGEASPLPGFSNETLNQVIQKIQSYKEDILAHFASPFTLESTYKFLKRFDDVPSLQFALLTAAATFLAQQKSISLQQLLFQPEYSSVPVNAVLGSRSQSRIDKIDHAVKSGYQTIKLKVDQNFPQFLQFVEKVYSQYPNLNIRIDTNQSWTLDQAITFLSKLQPYQMEYCEEPMREPDAKSIKILNEQCAIPIALDESVFRSFTISKAMELVPVIIFKPMVWGCLLLNDEFKKKAAKTDTKLVLTTSLESSIGRLMTATLAAGLGDSTLAHGLDTGRMLANDVWNDNQFTKNGRFYLPDAKHLKKLMNTKLSSLNLQNIAI